MNIEHKYYYSEIDKFANHQQDINFPDSVPLGDITKWMEWDIEWRNVDLILAGSPCQGFSFAGKQLNFSDERSKLFFVFVDILNHIRNVNPGVKFLLENVNMKKEYLRIISEYLGIFPVNINSNRVSAQNRNRWYWTNIRTKKAGLFDDLYTDIPQPDDQGILLKDILQDDSEIDEMYYLKDTEILNEGRSFNYFVVSGLDINKKAPTQRSSTGRSLDDKHNYQIIKLDKKGNKKPDQNKAGCLTGGGNSGGNHSDMDIVCVLMVGRKIGYDGYKLRRLTPTECARLQTVPDWYIWDVSDTQQYKMLGNGWTCKIIEHILKYLIFD